MVEKGIDELSGVFIYDLHGAKVLMISKFLETAATVTKNQSVSIYITLSLRLIFYGLLMKKCLEEIHNDDVTLKKIK